MFDVFVISNYILYYAQEHGNAVTNLRMQKTLYYLQGYIFKFAHVRLIKQDFVHWPYGPVILDSYYQYCHFVARPIDDEINEELVGKVLSNRNIYQTIKKVLRKCFSINVRELVNYTHKEAPWVNTEADCEISFDAISEYFSSNDPLGLEE